VTADTAQGLLLDYGGVLTTPVGRSFVAWERQLGVEPGEVLQLLVRAYDDADGGIVGALERGELSAAEFDARVTRLLAERGHVVPQGSVLDGLFAGMRPTGSLWSLAIDARRQGVRTGLLSNSWGTELYPWDRLRTTFDTLVISGEVGLRKPDPAIFHLAAEQLGLPPERCVFVDDLDRNVRAAERLGMRAILHDGDEEAVRGHVEAALGLTQA
jgi:epoxide hydrolase-like predicted phosphatase